jgi:hypothetical protein
MAGDDLGMGSGGPAECPTTVKEIVTLLVNSKTRGKTGVHTTFESQKDRGYASGEACSHGLGA